MSDLSFEEYWQQVTVELTATFGQAGADLNASADRIASCFQAGIRPASLALDIGVRQGLTPQY